MGLLWSQPISQGQLTLLAVAKSDSDSYSSNYSAWMVFNGQIINKMLEKILQSILRKYVGQFLTGLENLELGAWAGKIQLQNTALKHDHINGLLKKENIPLSLKYSSISSLSIDVPWTKISSAPVEIKISGIYIVFQLDKIKSIDKKIEAQKLALIKNYVDHLTKKIADEVKKDQSDSGYFKNLIPKVLRNMNIEVSDISIRIDCNNDMESSETKSQVSDQMEGSRRRSSGKYYKPEKPFSLGFCLKSFSSHTVD